MSDYVQTVDFSAKDLLPSGDPSKLIKGSEFDAEFDAIATAIATKYDSADIATQAQAEAEASNVVLMTPLRVGQWADANAGMVGDIQALTDPGADRLLFWDDSAGAVAQLAVSSNLSISGTTLDVGSNVPLKNASNTFTNGSQTIEATHPYLLLSETDASANAGKWAIAVNSEALRLAAVADSFAENNVLSVTRSGATVGTVALAGTTITLNGVDVTDYARASQANTFAASQTVSTSGGSPHWGVTDATVTARFYAAGYAQIGSVSNHAFELYTNNVGRLTISASGDFDFKSGTVTTSNSSASEVGKLGTPSRGISSSDSTAASDAGNSVHFVAGAGQTFTLDADMPAHTQVVLINRQANPWTIACAGTLTLAGTTTTGSRTLSENGIAVAYHIGSNSWLIWGAGLT